MNKKTLKNLIEVASGRKSADLCIKNCKIVDVYNKDVFEGSIYIKDGYIAGFGNDSFPEAKETFDAKGRYVAPGFIDSHLHIESSHLSPSEYARLVVPCGTTTAIADPHEIVNVCGIAGLDYMLKASEKLPMSVFIQFPSCVPCTPFENSGAVLEAQDIRKRIDNPRILGLGELMDFVGLCAGKGKVIDKVMVAKNAGKVVDGHFLGSDEAMDAYATAGVSNDHECSTAEGLQARIRRGIYVLLRQGTVCHDLVNLCKGVNERNSQYVLMCTDDCQAKTMLEIGHIDNNVRMAIEEGIDPFTAICMATINAATCFKLEDRGAVAPGKRADLVVFKDLRKPVIEDVFSFGNHVASKHRILVEIPHTQVPEAVSSRMKIKDYGEKRFALKLKSDSVTTMKILPGSVVTARGRAKVTRDSEGYWVRNNDDIVKVAVVERHHNRGTVGLALIEGFGLKGGAVATTVAHDSHNLIVAGDNDTDMALAVGELVRLGGGMAVVKNGKILDSVQHEIAGLMTDLPGEIVAEKLAKIQRTARSKLGIHNNIDPFMTLCFMSLPVIPELKITDLGLFDVEKFRFIPVEL